MPVRLRLLWYPQAQFAGYHLAQHTGFAAARGLDLECVPIDFSLGAIPAILSDDCQFAVASPAHMLESSAPGDVVMLLALQQMSSLVYPARRAEGVHVASDVRGKRAAVWPGGEDLELRWMLKRSGVSASEVTLVPVNDTVVALMANDVSCAQMTTYHEVFELEHAAGSLEAFTMLHAADAGAALLKDGLFARRDYVAAHPQIVQAVVDSVLEGWTAAFDRPDEAVALCSRLRPDMTPAHQADQLEAIRGLSLTGATLTHGLGFPDPRHMDAARRAVHEVDGHDLGEDPGRIDRRFWDAAPAAFRRTTW